MSNDIILLSSFGQVSKMLKDYDWITVEKHLFGQPNSTYDFKANNPKEAGERLQKLQEMKEKLGRKGKQKTNFQKHKAKILNLKFKPKLLD